MCEASFWDHFTEYDESLSLEKLSAPCGGLITLVLSSC